MIQFKKLINLNKIFKNKCRLQQIKCLLIILIIFMKNLIICKGKNMYSKFLKLLKDKRSNNTLIPYFMKEF